MALLKSLTLAMQLRHQNFELRHQNFEDPLFLYIVSISVLMLSLSSEFFFFLIDTFACILES